MSDRDEGRGRRSWVKRTAWCGLLVCGLLQSGSVPAFAEEWFRIESDNGRASVLFPNAADAPEEIVDRTAGGNVVTRVAQHEGDGIVLSISKTRLPGVASVFAGKKMIFRNSKSGVLEEAHGQEISSEEVKVPGAKAAMMMLYEPDGSAEAEGDAQPPYQGQVLFVIVGQEIFTVNSMITKSTPENEAMQKKLFDSFEVHEEEKGAGS